MENQKTPYTSIAPSVYAMMPGSPDPFLEGSTVGLVPSSPGDFLNIKAARGPPNHGPSRLLSSYKRALSKEPLPSNNHQQAELLEQRERLIMQHTKLVEALARLRQQSDPGIRLAGLYGQQPIAGQQITSEQVTSQPTAEPPRHDIIQYRALDDIASTLPKNSPNYKGSLKNPANHCANIPEGESTCLFIVNLPPDCTPNKLLGAIRDTGKVWALNINPPNREHGTAAAKLTFWDREATDRFLLGAAAGGFRVGGRAPRVMMNRYRTPSQPASEGSRVLGLVGPGRVVNQGYLEGFFRRTFSYDLDRVEVVYQTRRATRLEFHFASYRCQAAFARRWVEVARLGDPVPGVQMSEEERALWRWVRPYWGVDPCDRDVVPC